MRRWTRLALDGKYQRRGTVGGVRYRGHGDGTGAAMDRWNRSEAQVREQLELAEKIADAIEACRQRSEEIEWGKTFGATCNGSMSPPVASADSRHATR